MTTTDARAHAASHPPGGTGRPKRDPWFDNAKMLLVTLVVVGHSWTLLPDSWGADRAYDWLYLWHMPAFLMVTGHLSRRFTYTPRNLRRVVTTLVLPYLVFEGLFALFRVHVGGEELQNLWLHPHWPLWFLIVLAQWRLVTPLLRRVPNAMLLSVLVSMVAGVVDIEAFDISRFLQLLPFYAAGVLIEERHLDALRTRAARLAGLPVLVGGLLVAHLVASRLGSEWLYYRTSYSFMQTSVLDGMLLRLCLIGVAFAMAAAVLAWIPRRGGWFSALGAGSLVVYLFHGFFVKTAEYAGFEGWAADKEVLAFVLVTGVSVVVALTLSWRPVRKPLEKVVTPAP